MTSAVSIPTITNPEVYDSRIQVGSLVTYARIPALQNIWFGVVLEVNIRGSAGEYTHPWYEYIVCGPNIHFNDQTMKFTIDHSSTRTDHYRALSLDFVCHPMG